MRAWMMTLGAVAGLFGAAGVALAAAGAHMSAGATVTTSAYLLLFHAAALIGFSGLVVRTRERGLLVAASAIAVGTILFSGELALHGLLGIGALAKAAPLGGAVMILGWLLASAVLPRAICRAEGG